MEFINKVEIQGIIGSVNTCKTLGGDYRRMSVATNRAFNDRDGENVIETTWFNVIAPGGTVKDPDAITKGSCVNVKGRIRYLRYTDGDQQERITTEIIATSVTKIDNNDQDNGD